MKARMLAGGLSGSNRDTSAFVGDGFMMRRIDDVDPVHEPLPMSGHKAPPTKTI
jgi:hypothetical protein